MGASPQPGNALFLFEIRFLFAGWSEVNKEYIYKGGEMPVEC